MSHLRVSGNGPPTQLLEQFCEITVIVDSVRTNPSECVYSHSCDSAVSRKGAPIKLCEKLVKRAESTKIISGRASIQGILDELSRGKPIRRLKGPGWRSALFCAEELSAGIVNDPEAIKILTDIYDFKDEYTSRLRGSGVFRIKNICFSMMAGSNEELLRGVYGSEAVMGVFLPYFCYSE